MTDPIDVIEMHDLAQIFVKMRKVQGGKSYLGLCPFHSEKTPSFRANAKFFKCFGCGESGNIYSFVMKGGTGQPMDYRSADRWLRQEFGLPPDEMHDRMEKFWEEFWAQSSPSDVAVEFWSKRGLPLPSGWGYCPPYYRPSDPEAARIAGFGDHGTLMNGRLTVPLRDINGIVVGCAGRALAWEKGNRSPKWMNTFFKKKDHLFGLYRAKNHIQSTGVAVLVEGYSDVEVNKDILKGAVASMGTSFTREHAGLLRLCGAKKLVLLQDGDLAGIKSMVKAGAVAIENGLEVSCVRLPEGEDPDSYTNSGKNIRHYISLNMESYSEFIKSVSEDPVQVIVQQAMAMQSPLAMMKVIREASLVNGIPQQVILDAIKYEKSLK